MYELSETVDELYRSGCELNNVQITQKLLVFAPWDRFASYRAHQEIRLPERATLMEGNN